MTNFKIGETHSIKFDVDDIKIGTLTSDQIKDSLGNGRGSYLMIGDMIANDLDLVRLHRGKNDLYDGAEKVATVKISNASETLDRTFWAAKSKLYDTAHEYTPEEYQLKIDEYYDSIKYFVLVNTCNVRTGIISYVIVDSQRVKRMNSGGKISWVEATGLS